MSLQNENEKMISVALDRISADETLIILILFVTQWFCFCIYFSDVCFICHLDAWSCIQLDKTKAVSVFISGCKDYFLYPLYLGLKLIYLYCLILIIVSKQINLKFKHNRVPYSYIL